MTSIDMRPLRDLSESKDVRLIIERDGEFFRTVGHKRRWGTSQHEVSYYSAKGPILGNIVGWQDLPYETYEVGSGRDVP